jgi:TPR repeat protein
MVCKSFGGAVAFMLLAAPLVAQTGAKASAADDPLHGKYYALVIGINAYPAPVPQLRTAVGDAKAVADVLSGRYGFEVKTLLNGDATRAHIFAGLTHYEIALRPNDSLLIYYAGHGFENKTVNKSYWLPVDADSMLSSNSISADDLTTAMATTRARHVLLISDSCYSGGLSRAFDDPALSKGKDEFLRKMLEGRSRNLMASGGDEPVDDGGPEGHSIFAYAVLKALQSEDQSMFTASDLFYGYVQRRVAGSSAQLPQYAPIRNSGDENGDFVFRRVDISEADEKNKLAAVASGYDRGFALYGEKQYFEAARLFASLCDSREARSCTALGFFFDKGLGVAKDAVQAAVLYRKGCDGGEATGCRNLGFMYEHGDGVGKNAVQAIALYGKGCDGGDAVGCSNLGGMYRDGIGVAKDAVQAAALYRKGCDGGDAAGCTNLGFMYDHSDGVTKDAVQVVALFRKGCDGGNALGCTDLGFMYQNGNGVAKNPVWAVALYRKGCDGGDALGCSNLGVMYRDGIGVAKDAVQAAALFRKGCDGGEAHACERLKKLQ